MLVSVVIPTYNRIELLPRAVDSVLSGTYQDIELIIIDDASTDGTAEYLESLEDPRVRKVSLKENRGVSRARNIGINLAKADWISFLDSDDEWLPEKLSIQIDLIRENPGHPLVHGEEIWIRNGKRVNPKFKHQKAGGDQFFRCLELCVISPSTAMIEKKEILRHGGFREDFVVCEDYDLWLKICFDHEILFTSKPLIKKYGGHQDQLSARYKAMDHFRVLSMQHLLAMRTMSDERRKMILNEVLNKSRILRDGYQKHGHLDSCQEVSKWIERAEIQINRLQE